MALGDKVIVTCAVTGAVTTKKQCAAIPYTAVEIGEECRRAYEAGISVVLPEHRPPFREIAERKRAKSLLSFSLSSDFDTVA